jgi:hypothetical protein
MQKLVFSHETTALFTTDMYYLDELQLQSDNPTLQAKIEMLHEAVTKGQLGDMEILLQEEKSRRMVLCKDSAGVPLLHKAVYYDHQDIVKWLAGNYPLTVSTKDRVSAARPVPPYTCCYH